MSVWATFRENMEDLSQSIIKKKEVVFQEESCNNLRINSENIPCNIRTFFRVLSFFTFKI